MKPADLASLLRLRRQREEKALNLVTARQSALARAEQEAQAANAAAAEHKSTSRDHEHQRLAGLIGRPMRAGEIANLQSSLNALADRHKDLVVAERQAVKRREERTAELTTAQAEFRKRHRQAEKLSALMSRLAMRQGRREAAIAESTTDELFTDRLAAGQANAQPASRNGDA